MNHNLTHQQQQQLMIDRQQKPRHRGTLPHSDLQAKAVNPLCGDELSIQIEQRDGQISQITYQGQGCIISQAGSDIQIDALIGKTLPEAQQLSEDDFINLLPIEVRPSRRRCALLLHQCLKQLAE